MLRNSRFKRFMLPGLLLSCLLLFSGCTMPSAVKTFDVTSDQGTDQAQAVTVDARNLLQNAVQTTNQDKEAQKFWYNGYVKNNIQKRTTTSMYEGVVIRPEKAFLVNGRMAGQPFQYYRWQDKYFIKKGDVWFNADKTQVLPFDPFKGFTDWLPFLKNAAQLPDDEVLSQPCTVVQVRITGKQWVQLSPSLIFADLKTGWLNDQALNHVLDNTTVKATFWIGKNDHYIYQYSTWIVMPLPGAGYFDQETYFRFYKYNDPGIESMINKPEEVEKWVKEYEEKIKSGEYEEEKPAEQPMEPQE